MTKQVTEVKTNTDKQPISAAETGRKASRRRKYGNRLLLLLPKVYGGAAKAGNKNSSEIWLNNLSHTARQRKKGRKQTRNRNKKSSASSRSLDGVAEVQSTDKQPVPRGTPVTDDKETRAIFFFLSFFFFGGPHGSRGGRSTFRA